MIKRTAKWLLCVAAGGVALPAQAASVCVYDPMGGAGELYGLMKDFAVVAKGFGTELQLKPYRNEDRVVEDYKAKKCDGMVTTDFASRPFNSYTGSLNAIGAVFDKRVARFMLKLMGNPKLAPEMVQNGHEVAGVFAVGMAYLVVNDRNINSLAKAQGIRFGVQETDPAQREMARKLGTVPVPVDVNTMGPMFNSGQVDSLGAPALAINAFELSRGMGNKGGVVRFPVALISANLVMRPEKFSEHFGQNSRQWFAAQAERTMAASDRQEKLIDAGYWMELPQTDLDGYVRLFREMRVRLVQQGVYNKKMTATIKKVRCQLDPSQFDCNKDGA